VLYSIYKYSWAKLEKQGGEPGNILLRVRDEILCNSLAATCFKLLFFVDGEGERDVLMKRIKYVSL